MIEKDELLNPPPSSWVVAWAICRRGVLRIVTRPPLILPIVVMPVVVLVSFTGAFSSLTRINGYGAENVYDWMTPYAALQGAVFAGVFGAAATAEDFESGFFDRLLLAPGRRLSLLVGTVWYSVLRSLLPTAAVFFVALAGGLNVPGGPLAVIFLFIGSAGIAIFFCVISLAVVYRMQTMRSLMIVQLVAFSSMFLSIGQVPLSFMDGWLHEVARLNPATNMLRFVRQGFIGDITWAVTWPGLVAYGSTIAAGFLLALSGLRRID